MKTRTFLIAVVALATPALAAKDKPLQIAARTAQSAPKQMATPQLPPPEAMIILIRSSLVALGHANATNNYSVLTSLGSPNFKSANPPQRLAQVFESFRTNRIDLNPVVFVTPQLTHQPAIQNGRLRLIGNFPTAPMRVNYDLQFEPDQGSWKLFGLAVNLDRAGSAAPAAPQKTKTGPAPKGR